MLQHKIYWFILIVLLCGILVIIGFVFYEPELYLSNYVIISSDLIQQAWNGRPFLLSNTEGNATNTSSFCNASFEPTFEGNLRYIQSYNLSAALPYMDKLQLNPRPLSATDQSVIQTPVFVSGCSTNHLKENLELMENIDRVVRPVIKDLKLVVFDLGLKRAGEREQLSAACKCTVRDFPFGDLPDHFRTIKGCVWKPIIIQLMLKEHPFVMWMDSSVRFTTGELRPLFDKAISLGIIQNKRDRPERELYITEQTNEQTFQVLKEPQCLYENQLMVEAGFILVYAKEYVVEGILKPWTMCALIEECMHTTRSMKEILKCYLNSPFVVNNRCHRYDQSVLNILMARLFHGEITNHWIVECQYLYFRNPSRCKNYDGKTFD